MLCDANCCVSCSDLREPRASFPLQNPKFAKLARHDRLKHCAPFEIARQCRREGFRALEHRLASRRLAANASRSRACFRRLYQVEREIPLAVSQFEFRLSTQSRNLVYGRCAPVADMLAASLALRGLAIGHDGSITLACARDRDSRISMQLSTRKPFYVSVTLLCSRSCASTWHFSFESQLGSPAGYCACARCRSARRRRSLA